MPQNYHYDHNDSDSVLSMYEKHKRENREILWSIVIGAVIFLVFSYFTLDYYTKIGEKIAEKEFQMESDHWDHWNNNTSERQKGWDVFFGRYYKIKQAHLSVVRAQKINRSWWSGFWICFLWIPVSGVLAYMFVKLPGYLFSAMSIVANEWEEGSRRASLAKTIKAIEVQDSVMSKDNNLKSSVDAIIRKLGSIDSFLIVIANSADTESVTNSIIEISHIVTSIRAKFGAGEFDKGALKDENVINAAKATFRRADGTEKMDKLTISEMKQIFIL